MARINSGILHNAVPLSTEAVKELERKVLENNCTFAYLDENHEICFSMPCGVDGIKDLAWHNAYELSDDEGAFIKKVYIKNGLKSYKLEKTLRKQFYDDVWIDSSAAYLAPGLYESGAIARYQAGDTSAADALKTSWANLEANGVLQISEGLAPPNNLPEQNEFGFYYGVPYTTFIDGCIITYTFNEDGSGTYTEDGEVCECVAGTFIYDDHLIADNDGYIPETVVSEDGLCLYLDGNSTYANIGSTYTPPNGTLWSVQGLLGYNDILLEGDLVLPNGITSLFHNVFYNQSNLTSIHLPDGLLGIGDSAFSDCTNLNSINIPDSVTDIGHDAFYYCSSLTDITIPNSVENFYGSFCGCASLINVTLPANMACISSSMFESCASLETIVIPSNVTSIDSWAFGSCSSLASIIIPESVQTIGESAFEGCENLSEVILSHDLIAISEYAFRNCIKLSSITIPNSLRYIHSWAFGNCASLRNITFLGTIHEWESRRLYDSWNYGVPATYVQCIDGQVAI